MNNVETETEFSYSTALKRDKDPSVCVCCMDDGSIHSVVSIKQLPHPMYRVEHSLRTRHYPYLPRFSIP